jgi:hypothetical protein
MIAKPESLENAGLSSTDHGGGKRRGFNAADTLNHCVSSMLGYSMAVWLRFFVSKTVTSGFGYLFFISFAAFSAASYVPNPDFSCRSTAT